MGVDVGAFWAEPETAVRTNSKMREVGVRVMVGIGDGVTVATGFGLLEIGASDTSVVEGSPRHPLISRAATRTVTATRPILSSRI